MYAEQHSVWSGLILPETLVFELRNQLQEELKKMV